MCIRGRVEEMQNCLISVVHIPRVAIDGRRCSLPPQIPMLVRYMLSSCVSLSVCQSHCCIVSKPLNLGSRK